MFGSKLTRANQREGDGKGAGRSETGVGGQGPFWLSGAVFTEQVYMTLVSDDFLLSLSMCKRGFHDLLSQAVFSIDVMWVHFQFSGIILLLEFPAHTELHFYGSNVHCCFQTFRVYFGFENVLGEMRGMAELYPVGSANIIRCMI